MKGARASVIKKVVNNPIDLGKTKIEIIKETMETKELVMKSLKGFLKASLNVIIFSRTI